MEVNNQRLITTSLVGKLPGPQTFVLALAFGLIRRERIRLLCIIRPSMLGLMMYALDRCHVTGRQLKNFRVAGEPIGD